MQLHEQIQKMKRMMQLNESRVQSIVHTLLPQLAAAAQGVYDQWNQNEEGIDDHYGGGGICDDIADAFTNVLANAGLGTTTHYNEYDYHTSAYACDENNKEIWKVDIHPSFYETGAAYTWKKIPGVVFSPDMITVQQEEWDNFFNDEGESWDY